MGTYTYADGEVDVSCYEAGADVGQGVKWSADRATAWELQASKKVPGGIPLDEAAKIAERIGLPPPCGGCAVHSTVIERDDLRCGTCTV